MAGKRAPGLRIDKLEATAKAKGLGQPAMTDAEAAYKGMARLFEMRVLLIDENYRASVNPDVPQEYPEYDLLQPACDAWNEAFCLTDAL
jgi:hypothetical protein